MAVGMTHSFGLTRAHFLTAFFLLWISNIHVIFYFDIKGNVHLESLTPDFNPTKKITNFTHN